MKSDELINRIKDLPSAPQILPPLLEALGNDNTDLDRVAELISVDPGLTAKLLKNCNSAFWALSTRIDSVSGALQRLGFQAVYRIVAAMKGAGLFKPSQAVDDAISSRWWRHAVLSA